VRAVAFYGKEVAVRLITIIAVGLLLGGCGPAPQTGRETQAIEAERKSITERQQREQAEARLHEQEARTSRWQFASVLAVSAAGFALIIGAALGSRARHDADQ
jgi:hypothetical protein